MSLKVTNLKKEFVQAGQRIEVLKGVNAEIKKGELVAILGQSGSGKTTLLSLLAGLDSPTSGNVSIDGVELNSLNQDQMTLFRGKNIGIVFQQFHLMPHLSALENVALPLEILGADSKTAKDKARSFLDAVGLSSRMDHFPNQLSGGEAQRVALARALVHEPKLLLADEPSGNLDVETGESVMNLFFDIVKKRNVTAALVTHDQNLAKRCDRQLFLKQGHL